MADFFDKETEDLGWAQMSALLDREMPVAKRRRRPILWWSLLGMGLLIGGVFYYQKKDAKKAVAVVQKPIAEVKPSGGNVSDTFEVSDTSSASSASKPQFSKHSPLKISDKLTNNDLQQSEKTFAQPSKPILPPNFSIKTPPQYPNGFSVEKTVSNSNEVVKNGQTTSSETEDVGQNVGNLTVASAPQKPQNTPPQYPSVLEPQPNPIVAQPKSQHDLLLPLPLNQAQALRIEEKGALVLEKTPLLMPKHPAQIHKWHFGIVAGVHTEGEKWLQNSGAFNFVDHNAPNLQTNDPIPMSDKQSKGFSAGLIVKYDLTSRWSVQSGLNYRQIDLGSRQFGYWQVNQDSVNNAYKSTGTGVTTNPSLSTVKSDYLRLSRLIYLEMPISMHYRFARKWSVGMGLKAGYLLKGESELIRSNAAVYILPVNGNGISRSFSTERFANYDAIARTSIGQLQIKRWDVAATGSLHFSPRCWDFSLRYDFGTLNVLKYQNSKDYNRFIGLNVAYFFR